MWLPEVLPDEVRGTEPLSADLDVALAGGPHDLMGRGHRHAARGRRAELDLPVELEDVAADPEVTPGHPAALEAEGELRVDDAEMQLGEEDPAHRLRKVRCLGSREGDG